MNDHVTKPIAPERLFATLARWIKLPAERQSAQTAASATPAPRLAFPPDLLALESIDAREGIRRIGGKADAYRRQLARFRDSYADAAAQLRAMIADGRLQEADSYCHALVGVAGNIGATRLFTELNQIGHQLRDGHAPEPEQIDTMAALLATLVADIDSIAGNAPESAQQEGHLLAAPALIALLDTLAGALEYDLGRAAALLAELRAGSVGSESAPAIAAIASAADDFAIEDAVRQTTQLRQRLASNA